MAVPVSGLADAPPVDDYTLENAVDYKILEQDYEEELTATQALNAEIAKAAIELAGQLDETASGEDTEELDAIDVALEITSEHTVDLEADVDGVELTDEDDTGINEALTMELPASDETAEMPETTRGSDDADGLSETTATTELTAELPSAENDPTAEMEIETGRFRSR